LAVVADDHAMGVTQVVRGDDLIASTFRQLDLLDCLGLSPPAEYAHVPLVVGRDGRRLAKRHGDTRLSSYRAAGCPPHRIVGWAAWTAGLIDRWQDCSPQELLEEFSWERLRRMPTIIDQEIDRRLAQRALD
jgi:glutamyl-tRNA synthetase